MLLNGLAVSHNARIKPYPRIVDEDPAVYLADIDITMHADKEIIQGVGTKRDFKVFGEMVEGSERKNAQPLSVRLSQARLSPKRRCRSLYGPVLLRHAFCTATFRLILCVR